MSRLRIELRAAKRAIVVAYLQRLGSVGAAAKALGIDRSNLRRCMRTLGISRRDVL